MATYKMRALAQSDNNYVFWTAFEPDLTGASAPETIVADTATILSVWGTASAQLVYEVDFSTQATQDLSSGGDGSKTIDGHTWYAWNTGTNNIRVTNGTGIEIDGGPNSQNRVLCMDISSLSIDNVNDDVEIWVDVSYTGTLVNYQFIGVSLDQVWASTPSRSPLPEIGWQRDTSLRMSIYDLAVARVFSSTNAFAIANDRVLVVRGKRNIPNLSDSITGEFHFHIGATTGSGWPEFSDLKFLYSLGVQSLDYSTGWGPTFIAYDDPSTQTLIIKKMKILKYI